MGQSEQPKTKSGGVPEVEAVSSKNPIGTIRPQIMGQSKMELQLLFLDVFWMFNPNMTSLKHPKKDLVAEKQPLQAVDGSALGISGERSPREARCLSGVESPSISCENV